MAKINVNPTRMELKKLKARLKTATRGHKLLKDKSDEMIRRFSVLIKRNKLLRDEVEKELASVLKEFAMAKALTSPAIIENAFMMPASSIELSLETTSVMNVIVPKIQINEKKGSELYPYSFTGLTSEADYSVRKITGVLVKLTELAEVEKQVTMLADEIEKNKRRVNALEYVMIPQLEETISYISSKLEENERAATTRLMKVKAMLEDRA